MEMRRNKTFFLKKMHLLIYLYKIHSYLQADTIMKIMNRWISNINFFFSYRYINVIFFCCHWLAMSNSCYNPFIYGIFSVSIKSCRKYENNTQINFSSRFTNSVQTILMDYILTGLAGFFEEFWAQSFFVCTILFWYRIWILSFFE